MDALLNTLLVILYPCLPIARLVNALLGRDRLRLRRPSATASCWIERGPDLDIASYFSEASTPEGHPRASAAQSILQAVCLLARVYAPTRQHAKARFVTAAHRDENIPDEVYTLW
jgi:hypothetical protein